MIYTLYRVCPFVKPYFFRGPWDVHEIMTFVGPQPIGQRVTSAQCRVKLLAHRAGLPGNVDYDYTVGFPPRPCSRKAGHPADLPVTGAYPVPLRRDGELRFYRLALNFLYFAARYVPKDK